MSNIIGFSKAVFGKERISMSNQGTDCFLELLELAAAENNMTNNQRKLIVFLKERREENLSAPGTASFDVDEMPWSKDTLSEDVVFMMKVIEKAKTVEVTGKLDYRPDLRIVSPWLDQFSSMIWKLDKDYLYGIEEKELVKEGLEAIRTVLYGKNSSAKRRLLFYLDQYLDPFYQNDLTGLYNRAIIICRALAKITRLTNKMAVVRFYKSGRGHFLFPFPTPGAYILAILFSYCWLHRRQIRMYMLASLFFRSKDSVMWKPDDTFARIFIKPDCYEP